MPPKICYEPALDRSASDRYPFSRGRRESRESFDGFAGRGRWEDRPRRAGYAPRSYELRVNERELRVNERQAAPESPVTEAQSASAEGVESSTAVQPDGALAAASKHVLSEVGSLMDRLLRMLVDIPDAVAMNEVSGTFMTVIEVSVAKTDHGKVIGRGGRTADALRDILATLGSKHHRRFQLEFLE